MASVGGHPTKRYRSDGSKKTGCGGLQEFQKPHVLKSFFLFTLPETNSSPLKMDGWNTTFLLGRGILFLANLPKYGGLGDPYF